MGNNCLYRYTSNSEGVWSVGKRLLPEHLVSEANENRKWLAKPNLPKGEFIFYMTHKGKEMYEKTLLKTHQKYLVNIICVEVSLENAKKKGEVVYQDEHQVVIRVE